MDGAKAHADLLQFFPDAISAECDESYHGYCTVTYPEPRGRIESQCPGCWYQAMDDAIAAIMPPRFREVIDLPEAIATWAALGKKAQGLYLAGQVGTGKTHAAWGALAAWCRAAAVKPRTDVSRGTYDTRIAPNVIFTRMTDLLDDLRPGDESRQRIRDCQAAELLVIDDLGAEKPSEWTQERFYSVIDERYTRQRPLIVTSNLPPSKLAAQVGERSASRLAEMCEIVAMTGPDRRRPAS